MSPSSSGSWTGAGADIIDLDRYMRGNVRPSRTLSEERGLCEQLVVDGGGVGRKLIDPSHSARHKHYSHDSGVSDGSYDQRIPPRPRRACNSDGRVQVSREHNSTRTFNGQGHSDSLQAFRTVCEQALLDQQKQIARVAQLCEKLTERAETERDVVKEQSFERQPLERLSTNERLKRGNVERRFERLSERHDAPSETSDISSSSHSTKDLRRKERDRTQECKTYKIIMTKLDELNRRFSPPRPACPTCPTARRRIPSSSSVSVCDKLIATEPERTVDKIIRPGAQKIYFQSTPRASLPAPVAPSLRPRVVAQAFSVDIAPRDVMLKAPNVATESVIKCESSSGCSSSAIGDPRCNFDLEDPVHLYSQAKRLQALNATTRRCRSRSSGDNRSNTRVAPAPAARCGAEAGPRAGSGRPRSPSLCSMCRGYWRSLRDCLVGPFTQDCK